MGYVSTISVDLVTILVYNHADTPAAENIVHQQILYR